MAHTANDSVDTIDGNRDKYLRSIPNLPGVAGVLVSNENDLVFTSNRGEKTVGIFLYGHEDKLQKASVGGFPNGLAYDAGRNHLLTANVSKPEDPNPVTVSIVDPTKRILLADIEVPGRTRWTVYDEKSGMFYVNISKPSQIVAVNSNDPDGIERSYDIPATGPHGMDIDLEGRRLFCACDQGGLFTLDLTHAKASYASPLAGAPDVIFYNSRLKHLYIAIGEPGVIQVFDTKKMEMIQTVNTEHGAHTIAFNPKSDKVYAFLPESHQARVFVDK